MFKYLLHKYIINSKIYKNKRSHCALNHIDEAAVLSTCNRMEIYVIALSQHRGVKEVTDWMSKVCTLSTEREKW